MIAETALELSRCHACHAQFLPTDGPCPKCGSTDCVLYTTSAVGKVLVSTEIHYPPSGWHAPHRLAMVEVAGGVRVLVIIDGALPGAGALVEVRHDGAVYRARAEPSH